jgi:hypothetical protein
VEVRKKEWVYILNQVIRLTFCWFYGIFPTVDKWGLEKEKQAISFVKIDEMEGANEERTEQYR